MFSERVMLLMDEPTKVNGVTKHNLTDVKEVWAESSSIKYSEFYAASAAGRGLTAVFRVHPEDYAKERFLRWNGHVYRVDRPYQKGQGDWELSCVDETESPGESV